MIPDRRAILGASVALPAWLSLGFAPMTQRIDAPRRLQSAIVRSRKVGKPLLVLLVPDDPDQAGMRSRLWGHYLSNLTDEEALDLSLCEVTCASADEISIATSQVQGIDDKTWAMVLMTDVDPVTAALVHGELPIDPLAPEPSADLRSALAKMLHTAIVPDMAAQVRLVRQCGHARHDMQHLFLLEADSDVARFETIDTNSPVRRVDLDRWAAYARYGQGTPHAPKLADAARIRLFENAPDGAEWMIYSDYCPTCGMGRVSAGSRWFLKFLTQ